MAIRGADRLSGKNGITSMAGSVRSHDTQFSLRALFLATTLVAVAFAVLPWPVAAVLTLVVGTAMAVLLVSGAVFDSSTVEFEETADRLVFRHSKRATAWALVLLMAAAVPWTLLVVVSLRLGSQRLLVALDQNSFAVCLAALLWFLIVGYARSLRTSYVLDRKRGVVRRRGSVICRFDQVRDVFLVGSPFVAEHRFDLSIHYVRDESGMRLYRIELIPVRKMWHVKFRDLAQAEAAAVRVAEFLGVQVRREVEAAT